MTHVFVYGTLMRGGANHAVLARLGARYVASARTARGRTLVDLGPYPALLPQDDARDALAPNVHGEIYELDDAELPSLDAFEGCPTLYTRARIALTTDAGAAEAWVYVFARALPRSAQPVATGRYVKVGAALAEGADASQLDDE
jgi:gamma-glutamylaminecyclotransferase